MQVGSGRTKVKRKHQFGQMMKNFPVRLSIWILLMVKEDEFVLWFFVCFFNLKLIVKKRGSTSISEKEPMKFANNWSWVVKR